MSRSSRSYRRPRLTLLLASCALAAGACSPEDRSASHPAGAAQRPNIVFLLADDQRFDALGAAGDPIVETPHLDRLAAEGVRFTNAFCTTSICPTSRATFLTGQYASRHGVVDFATGLTDSQLRSTWIGVLQEAGYRSAFVGKWGLGGELPRTTFDIFRGFAGHGRYFTTPDGPSQVDGEAGPPAYLGHAGRQHLTDHHATVASELIESPSLEEPFLLQLSFKAPHAQDGEENPFQFDPRFAELYSDTPIAPPPSATEAAFSRLPEMLRSSEGRIRWHRRFASDEQRLESVRSYYRLISGIDDALGRLWSALERRGIAERTVIVFSSDNGLLLGEHGLAGKWFPFEESIRIPLVIFDPRLPTERRGATPPAMVLNVDLAPTLIELGGGTRPPGIQGHSLVPILSGETPEWRRDWYYEHRFGYPTIPSSEAVRTERWKLGRYTFPATDSGDGDGDGSGRTVEQLFDLDSDPYELEDLSTDERYADRLAALRARLDELRAAAQ